jgi:DNA-binding transcriptional LysR family regulator
MELRHLRYFVTVAEEEHITRAAMRLGMKQPPLSQQIRQLEDEIGVSLFDRHPKRIALNAAGKIFLSDARRILAAAEDAIDRVRKFDLGQEGTILIGMTSSASVHPICIEIVREFRAAQPLVSIQIEEGANHDLLVMLEEERLDFAFVRSGVDRYPLVTCRTLAMSRWSWQFPPRMTWPGPRAKACRSGTSRRRIGSAIARATARASTTC